MFIAHKTASFLTSSFLHSASTASQCSSCRRLRSDALANRLFYFAASQCQAAGSSCSSQTADESCTTCFPSSSVDLWSPLGTSWGSSGCALVVMGQASVVNFARTSCASSQPFYSDLFCDPGRHQTLAWRPRATSIWRSLPHHQTS